MSGDDPPRIVIPRAVFLRLLSLIAIIAHHVDQWGRAPLRPVRLGWVPAGALIVMALGGLTVSTGLATLRAYDARPQPVASSIGAVARVEVFAGIWVSFDAVVDLDSFEAEVPIFDAGAPIGVVVRRYYFARDPAHLDEAIVLRSQADPGHAVVRELPAAVVTDPHAVAEGLEALGTLPVEVAVDPSTYLDERAPGVAPESAASPLPPSAVASAGRELALVEGRVLEVSAPAGDGLHWYVIADRSGDAAMLLRSSHPPGAVPVRVDGTIVQDAFNLRSLLETWNPEALHPGIDTLSRTRLVAWGIGLGFQEPSWLPTMGLAVLAFLLAVGLVAGYPIFRRHGARPPAAVGAAGDIAIQIVGTLPGPRGRVQVDGVPGHLGRLPVSEVARTHWRYWGAGLGEYRHDIEAALRTGGRPDRLVVHSPVGSLLWSVDDAGPVTVELGEAYVGWRRAHAIRVSGTDVHACLIFRSAEERDQGYAELQLARASS